MKVGITTSVMQRGQTGIAQYVLGLAHAFVHHAMRHQFTWFVLEEDLPLFDFAGKFMDVIPVEERFRPPTEDIYWHQQRLPRLARELGLDVLHVPSYRRMLWRRPCASVATIHDLAPFRVHQKYEWKRTIYCRIVARLLARRQHEIIAVSERTAGDIRQFFQVPAARLTVIHNGIDHDRFCPGSREQAGKEVARKHGIQAPFFLYVSRLEHPGKNHVLLVEAFNRFKLATRSDWQLVLVGKEWDGADKIREAIRRSPHAGDIITLGFVEASELPVFYRAAGAFVYPSLHEGFGLPPVEAMACKCPVITSPRGALAEVVGESAITADPEDVMAWKDQMMRLATSEDRRELWGEAGLARARRFDWNRAAAMTLKVYARAVDRAKGLPVGPVLEDALAGDQSI